MSTRFLAPDLTQLAVPQLIEEVDFEVILAAQKTWVLARWDEVRVVRPDLPPLDTLGLETEPMNIILQAYAYRETLVRALINDKARAVLLAYAVGTDLDALGALFATYRLTISAGPPVVMESDDRFRRRIQLAPEAFSTCGPRGAYIYFALTYSPLIVDAWAYCPDDGRVTVVVAGENGADLAEEVLGGLVRRYAQEDIVPLTDVVTVRRADRTNYAVELNVYFQRGPDPDTIEEAIGAAVAAYNASVERIGATVFRSGLISSARIGAVDNVVLVSPPADVVCDDDHIPHCTGITINLIVGD